MEPWQGRIAGRGTGRPRFEDRAHTAHQPEFGGAPYGVILPDGRIAVATNSNKPIKVWIGGIDRTTGRTRCRTANTSDPPHLKLAGACGSWKRREFGEQDHWFHWRRRCGPSDQRDGFWPASPSRGSGPRQSGPGCGYSAQVDLAKIVAMTARFPASG